MFGIKEVQEKQDSEKDIASLLCYYIIAGKKSELLSLLKPMVYDALRSYQTMASSIEGIVPVGEGRYQKKDLSTAIFSNAGLFSVGRKLTIKQLNGIVTEGKDVLFSASEESDRSNNFSL